MQPVTLYLIIGGGIVTTFTMLYASGFDVASLATMAGLTQKKEETSSKIYEANRAYPNYLIGKNVHDYVEIVEKLYVDKDTGRERVRIHYSCGEGEDCWKDQIREIDPVEGLVNNSRTLQIVEDDKMEAFYEQNKIMNIKTATLTEQLEIASGDMEAHFDKVGTAIKTLKGKVNPVYSSYGGDNYSNYLTRRSGMIPGGEGGMEGGM